MTVQIQKPGSPNITLVEHVMQNILGKIASRALVPGMKLPSIRKFAQSMEVSKSTVVDAYDRLVAEGVIKARRGSGFYVAGHVAPLTLSEMAPQLDHAVDPLWEIGRAHV